jgi:hypothetical protein
MNAPSTRELLKRLQLIEEQENGKGKISLNEESGPEDTEIKQGSEQKIVSKDDHSSKVKQSYGQGSTEANKSYEGNDKSVNDEVKNSRSEGSEESEEAFTGSDKAISDNFKMKKGSEKTVSASEGASKEFANYREKIRAAMRGGLATPINKPEYTGNTGLNKK